MVQVIGFWKRVFVSILDFVVMLLFRAWQLVTLKWLRIRKDKSWQRQVRKILVINSGFIGDSILAEPLLRNLRKAYPRARIAMLVNPLSSEMWTSHPSIDLLITYAAPWITYSGKGWLKGVKDYFRTIHSIRKLDFDLVIDPRGDMRNNLLLVYSSGARIRTGFGYTGGAYCLTHVASWKDGMHEAEKNISLLQKLGIPARYTKPELPTPKVSLPVLPPSYVVINPFGGYSSKEWPLDRWISLIKDFPKTMFVLVGGRKDVDRLSGISLPKNTQSLVGTLSLQQTAALLKRAALLVGIDSGPAHLAAAVGCKTLTLFGPTDERRWRPYGDTKNNAIIKKDSMKHIRVPEVVGALKESL